MAIDLAADAAAIIGQDFGETVVYHKRGGAGSGQSGAEDRTIKAIVDREAVETFAGMERSRAYSVTVEVANHATLGILSSEIDTGSDQIAVARRYGETPVKLGIKPIVTHDAGAVRLELL